VSHPGEIVNIPVDAGRICQTMDGFGVNINARYWNTELKPAMNLLRYDLGATLYRVDIWGKSNWIDPTSELGPGALNENRLTEIYTGEIFRRGWSMLHWLNETGIQPYLTASGDVPKWMLGSDGKTLVDIESFTEMLVSLVEWARKRERLNFCLFGPLNETDIGSPEGPTVNPENFVQICELLTDKLEVRNLTDIQLVVPEASGFNTAYLNALVHSQKLRGRIGAFGMHSYGDMTFDHYQDVYKLVEGSAFAGTPLWMTEYGDLEQSGEREWYVAWVMTRRLLDYLQGGFRGALVWDAYDNYHDHDEAWTIYGLLRTGLRVYTPKKRYFACKQFFHFVLPGFVRLGMDSSFPGLRILAFADPTREKVTMVGMNEGLYPLRLNIQLTGFPEPVLKSDFTYYRTSEQENCHTIGQIPAIGKNWPFTGLDVLVPAASIFTLSTLQP